MIVLLVEDDPATRELLVRILEKRSIAVVPVRTIAEAKKAPKVDLIVSDWDLPDGTARDLQLGPPVVVLSGYEKPPDGSEWVGVWVRKPIHYEGLVAAIQTAIARAGE